MTYTVEYTVGSRRGSVSVRDAEGWEDHLADAVAREARIACRAALRDGTGPADAEPLNPYRGDTPSWVAFEQGVIAQRLLMGLPATSSRRTSRETP